MGAHWPSSRDHSLADILRKMDAIAVNGRSLDREESKRPVSALAGHADLTHQPSACAADCYHGTALDLEQKELMGGYAALTHKLGGEFVHLHGRSVAATLRDFIQASLATEVILGHRRSRWTPWDTTSELIRGLAGVDVHILRKRDTA